MKEELKIEAGKFYRTRDGRKAGIYKPELAKYFFIDLFEELT